MFFPNEDRYDGFWKKNQPYGEGRMIYKNGDVYVGQWYEGLRNGYGVLTKRNGDHFEGCWVKDKREGQGSYFFAEKNKLFVGEYVNDMPKCGISSEVADNMKVKKEPENPIAEEDENQISMPGFDDIPPIPKLELRDPIGVLQQALDDVKDKRMFYRARFMALHVLFQNNEVHDLISEYTAACEARNAKELLLQELVEVFPAIGIDCDFDSLYSYYLKLICDNEKEMQEVREDPEIDLTVNFDLFARLVAIILEEANKLDEHFE